MYNLKKFTKTSSKSDDRISITRSNSFGFPRDFCNHELGNKPPYVVLYYDNEKKAIAFHFTSDETEKHKFKITYSNQGYGANVTATSFFKVNGLKPKTYRGKYGWKKITMEEIGELFVIEALAKESDTVHDKDTPPVGI